LRSRLPPEYSVPDDPDHGKMDAAFIRTCLGIRTPPGETPLPMPVAVRRAHYDMARSLSLLGAMGPNGMDPTQLATVVALALRDPEMEIPKRTAEQPEKAREPKQIALENGQKVVVYWRGKDHPGHYLHIKDGELTVLVNGDERRFRPNLVRLPTENEFPEVAENINQPAEVA